jgi:hypothetical protein
MFTDWIAVQGCSFPANTTGAPSSISTSLFPTSTSTISIFLYSTSNSTTAAYQLMKQVMGSGTAILITIIGVLLFLV